MPDETYSPFFAPHSYANEKLDQLMRFLEHMEAHVKSDQKWLEEEGHVDLDIEFKDIFSDVLPAILYSSVALSTVIFLETHLKLLCKALQKQFVLPLSLGDLSGSTIERFRRYAEKVAGLSIGFTHTSWDDLLGMFEIRNCLVHQDGDLTEFAKQSVIRSFYSRHGIGFPSDGQIRVDQQLCNLFLTLAYGFVDDIYLAAYERESKKGK